MDGRCGVVTGAASGIGRALATRLAERGMRVVLADRDLDAVRSAAAEIRRTGATTLAVQVDVADPDAVQRLADETRNAFGDVHLLCNNAGVLRPGSTYAPPLADWQTVLGVNVMGVVHGLRSFVPAMLAHGDPCHVLNTASIGGLIAAPHMAAYVASKHAVVVISENLAGEVANTRMGVTVLCPGGVATSIYRTEVERRSTAHDVDGSDSTAELFERMAAPDRSDQAQPDEIADVAIRAIVAGDLYAMAFNTDMRDAVRRRFRSIEQAMDAEGDRR